MIPTVDTDEPIFIKHVIMSLVYVLLKAVIKRNNLLYISSSAVILKPKCVVFCREAFWDFKAFTCTCRTWVGPFSEVNKISFEEWKTNLMSLAILFHFLCAQHVSDIKIPIIRSLRLFCWITTLVVLFLVRCVLEFRCGWVGVVSVLQAASACKRIPLQPNHTETPTHTEPRTIRPMW